MFPGLRIRVGTRPIRLVLKMHVTVAPVWIHARVHDDNGALQQVGVRGGERLDGGHGRFRANRLVAMDVVAQVHPNHAIATVHTFVHAPGVLCHQRIKSLHVFRRGHHEPQQRTSFRRFAVGAQLPVRNRFRHVLHIVYHEVVPCEGFAQVMPDEGLR